MIKITNLDPDMAQNATELFCWGVAMAIATVACSWYPWDDCQEVVKQMTITDISQFIDIVKSCPANSLQEVDSYRFNRLLNRHPISYFSSSEEVYRTICSEHYSTPYNDPNNANLPESNIRRKRFKVEIAQPYVAACAKHHWLVPSMVVGSGISIALIARAAYVLISAMLKD